MQTRPTIIAAAVVLACAAAGAAHAALERVGPPSPVPTAGGFPAWFQDRTGVTLEFCDLSTQAEWDGGWCVISPPEGPPNGLPESFPDNFFDEHFYYVADNTLRDDARGFRARLVLALEAIPDGGHSVFSRHRLDIRNLPFDGDYRVVTPFMDVTFFDQPQGERIFETIDIGIGCPDTFECTLGGTLGPFLLPSAVAGGAELPPMPDLISRPRGTDPFFDVARGTSTTATADPGTGKKYLADPNRVGPVTGSPLGKFTANNVDGSQTPGRDHNTFRIEVREPSPDHNGRVIYTIDGETNFSVAGRLMAGTLPAQLKGTRAVYHADASGTVTDLDVFAVAAPTVRARVPGTPQPENVKPLLSFYPQPCAGAIGTKPDTGETVVNPPPYGAPPGTPIPMENSDGNNEYWGQASPGGLPPSHVCIVDDSALDSSGHVAPVYSLRAVTDDVRIPTARFDGPLGGTLTVKAVSSDPTAVLTLAGFGPGSDGSTIGVGAGSGVELVGNSAKVHGLKAAPAQVQVVSSKGGVGLRFTDTKHGATQLIGPPIAVNDSLSLMEDCSDGPASACAAGAEATLDLLANDTVQINGTVENLRDVVERNLLPVSVTLTSAGRIGTASVSNGFLKYQPQPNANGTDSISYRVSIGVETVPDSNPGAVAIEVKPVNDPPVAGDTASGAVATRPVTMNLLATASDPDGAADIRNAEITNWPAALGAQPTPVNGVVNFVPPSTGTFNFDYRVLDANNVVSANGGKGKVAVVASEPIVIIRARYTRLGGRWRVDGTDRVKAHQTITVAYQNGTFAKGPFAGQSCDGTTAIPDCVVGTAVMGDASFVWTLLQNFGSGGAKDPSNSDHTWSTPPSKVRAFSSSPELGGSATFDIEIN